jgi:hypothetical protein
MSDKQQITRGKRAAPYVTTAVALEIVSFFGFAYLTDSHVPGISPLAATSIFIDGTKDIFPTEDSQAPDRMRNALNGQYDQCGAHSTGPCAGNVYIDYSRDFGILTDGVGYDKSTADAATKTLAAIQKARADNPCQTSDCSDSPIYVVGYSQGAKASSDVYAQILKNNAGKKPGDPGYIDTRGLNFVMLGNPTRNDGGLWSRLPPGVYVPFLGLSLGGSTNPSTDPNAPQVLMITKQYDGAADWPKYVLVNPLAAANAIMGYFYVHTGYYATTDVSDFNAAVDTNHDGTISDAEIAANNADPNSKYIVTRNGNVTDVLIKNQPGDLPITEPLKQLGVPPEVIKAIDPLLRAIIEAGYQRPTDGVYPAKPVSFGIIPKPDKMFRDFLAIEAGADQTGQNLEALNPLAGLNPLQTTTPMVGGGLLKQASILPKTLEPPPPPPAPKLEFKQQQQSPITQFIAPQGIPEVSQFASNPQPTTEELPPPTMEETPPVLLPTGNTTGTQNIVRPSAGAVPMGASLKKIATAINGVVTGTVTAIQNALTPKPAGSSSPSSSSPPPPANTDPPASGGTDNGTDTSGSGSGTTP